MSYTFRLSLTFLLTALTTGFLYATHNRAGEIHIEQIGPCGDLTIRATVITYTKASAIAADRDSLEVDWGDGTREWVYRVNGNPGPSGLPFGQPLGNDIKLNLYVATHTYPSRATYRISMQDPNRVDNILNVNFPNSVNVLFYIETVYTFLNPQFQGCNTTPYLLQPPIDFGCVGRRFIHNPSAYDPDGDSLSYHLVQPLQSRGNPVPNYLFPDQIGSGGMNTLSLDPVTGDLVWENPLVAGEYNIAMIIVSYRNGVPLDTTIRDMQVLVRTCNNAPPVITAEDELCVLAGETLSLPISVNDPNVGQLVRLSATGGPFESNFSVTQLIAPPGFVPPVLNALFTWDVACEEIRRQPWTIVFKAEDNDTGTPLVDIHSLRITVVGPPPEDLQGSAGKEFFSLSWEAPYSCEDTVGEYFRGFSVWRRFTSNPFTPDTCEPGLDGKGYTRIAFGQKNQENGRYQFTDSDVEPGRTYCYRILADFARLSAGGNPFSQVSSLPSAEICLQLQRDVPLLTTVSVEATNATDGAIELMWTKPRIPDLDTLLFPGPYRYRLMRSTGIGTTDWLPVPGAEFEAPTYWEANDTFFRFDTPLDSRNLAFNYQVEFYAESDAYLGASSAASSIFLQIASSDRRNTLTWDYLVPWVNTTYEIERRNLLSGEWENIGLSDTPAFEDKELTNEVEYCYRVKAFGSYGISDIQSPLINYSQEACGIPLDSVPPCPPTLMITNVCDSLDESDPYPEELWNRLSWTNPERACPDVSDVARYEVYIRRPGENSFSLLGMQSGATDTAFTHNPEESLAACYYVVAIDSVGNVSRPSNTVCVDNCPDYRLPNTFTPNGDGDNDFFIPYPFRFVERVDFQVFNRWGNLVWETNNPDLGWDGRNMQGKELAEGVYYYTCVVYEQRVEGIVPATEPLKGFIHLIRGN